jgi:hypothetical protein
MTSRFERLRPQRTRAPMKGSRGGGGDPRDANRAAICHARQKGK